MVRRNFFQDKDPYDAIWHAQFNSFAALSIFIFSLRHTNNPYAFFICIAFKFLHFPVRPLFVRPCTTSFGLTSPHPDHNSPWEKNYEGKLTFFFSLFVSLDRLRIWTGSVEWQESHSNSHKSSLSTLFSPCVSSPPCRSMKLISMSSALTR